MLGIKSKQFLFIQDTDKYVYLNCLFGVNTYAYYILCGCPCACVYQ